jgi:hypothetical protein
VAEWAKYPMDTNTRKAVETFHEQHADALQAMAAELRAAGIMRVHFGLDFNNDEPELSDYGVIEYDDGRVQEITEWFAALDQDVFWAFPTGTGTYTFDAVNVRVLEDERGGVIDTYEGVSQAYHSQMRRSKLEAEAETAAAELAEFMREYSSDS